MLLLERWQATRGDNSSDKAVESSLDMTRWLQFLTPVDSAVLVVVVVVVVLWQQAERESDRQATEGKWPVVMRAMQC